MCRRAHLLLELIQLFFRKLPNGTGEALLERLWTGKPPVLPRGSFFFTAILATMSSCWDVASKTHHHPCYSCAIPFSSITRLAVTISNVLASPDLGGCSWLQRWLHLPNSNVVLRTDTLIQSLLHNVLFLRVGALDQFLQLHRCLHREVVVCYDAASMRRMRSNGCF